MKNKFLNFAHLKGDVFGGITAGVVALPLALAFGVASGMGPEAGIYGAIAIGLIAAVFGGTPTQVSGPTGPMTVVSAGVIALIIERSGSLEAGLGLIIATFFLAGLIELFLGIARLGKYIKYIPYPVISGFMTGIGLIIILLQVFPFFGLNGPSNPLNVLLETHSILGNMNWAAVGLALGTIGMIYLFPKLTKIIPSTLVALVLGTLAAVLFRLDVPLIGDIPTGLPDVNIGAIFSIRLSDLSIILIPAITLAALGAIDSLLTSLVADNLTKTKHNSNRELVGQGLGNMAAALIGGIPGAGATMRTVVNVNTGGKTRLSGVIHSILLIIIMLGAGSLAELIPQAVLAGILITVGIGIVDVKGLKHLRHVPRTDAVVLLVVLALTVFVDLIVAVGVGVTMASILFMKQVGDLVEKRSYVKPLEQLQPEIPWQDEMIIPKRLKDKIYIKHMYGPLFFGASSRIQQLAMGLSESIEVVVIRMERVPYFDQTGLYAFEELVNALHKKEIKVFVVGMESQPRDMLTSIRFIPRVLEEKYLFEDIDHCVSYLKERYGLVGKQEIKQVISKPMLSLISEN